jgi:oligoribonuclease
MPQLAKVFHYRKIDVSSIKEIAWRKYPEVAILVNKQMKHRGLDDIKESIEELKVYESKMFMNPESKIKNTLNT